MRNAIPELPDHIACEVIEQASAAIVENIQTLVRLELARAFADPAAHLADPIRELVRDYEDEQRFGPAFDGLMAAENGNAVLPS